MPGYFVIVTLTGGKLSPCSGFHGTGKILAHWGALSYPQCPLTFLSQMADEVHADADVTQIALDATLRDLEGLCFEPIPEIRPEIIILRYQLLVLVILSALIVISWRRSGFLLSALFADHRRSVEPLLSEE
jgi:hypothetical protein